MSIEGFWGSDQTLHDDCPTHLPWPDPPTITLIITIILGFINKPHTSHSLRATPPTHTHLPQSEGSHSPPTQTSPSLRAPPSPLPPLTH